MLQDIGQSSLPPNARNSRSTGYGAALSSSPLPPGVTTQDGHTQTGEIPLANHSTTTHLRTSEECQYLVRGDRDVIMQRIGKQERWINPYVPNILRIWKGNMDVQAVIEPHATMAYLLSYVTKHHRDETKWLDECTRELQTQGNTNVRSMLFKYGNCYLSNRKIEIW